MAKNRKRVCQDLWFCGKCEITYNPSDSRPDKYNVFCCPKCGADKHYIILEDKLGERFLSTGIVNKFYQKA